jgi:hypothetical protein
MRALLINGKVDKIEVKKTESRKDRKTERCLSGEIFLPVFRTSGLSDFLDTSRQFIDPIWQAPA